MYNIYIPIWNAGILAVSGALSTVVALHISTLICSETLTLKTLLLHYIIFKGLDFYSPFVFSKLTKMWKNPRKEHEKLLRHLVSRDLNTEYGRRYLQGIKSLRDLRQKHPLTKFEHFEEYFRRLANGEKNVCMAGTVDRFGLTSGTTGKGKLMPTAAFTGNSLLLLMLPRMVCKPSPLQRAAFLYCRPAVKFTKSGLPIGPAVFIPDNPRAAKLLSVIQNSPFCAFQIPADFEANYIHLLFALSDKNIFIKNMLFLY